MIVKRLIIPLSVLFILASCKKGNSSASGNAGKLKTYIEDVQTTYTHETDTFAVTYDNDDRIISLASPILKFQYTYHATSFTLDLYENNRLSIHEISYLNSIPLVDSTFQFNDTNDSTTEKYAYSGNLLTRKTAYSYSTGNITVDTRDDYTYDNNGNMVQDVQTDGQANVNAITTYTYTTIPLSVTVNPIYFPQQSKYFPATEKQMDGNGSVIAAITYTYMFDSGGRVVKETDTIEGVGTAIKTYIY